jgi:Transglycosylase SLT domain
MTALRRLTLMARQARQGASASTLVFLRDVGHGLLEVSHNTLALVGFLLVGGLLFAGSQADIRHMAETHALGWLQARHLARAEPVEVAQAVAPAEPDAVARATASDPRDLNKQQAAVANWLSRRYRVAPEPISRLVQEAWAVGDRAGLDPTLILAIMAVESSFNPFAQSPVGAQGLMQVMTKIHDDKYSPFGGVHAAFDPVTNLRVGVQVLKECIARAGSLEAGLKYYVGAANLVDDGGYAGKVLAEQSHLRAVAGGKSVSPQAAIVVAAVAAPAPAPASAAAGTAREMAPAAPALTPTKAEEQAPIEEKVALLR